MRSKVSADRTRFAQIQYLRAIAAIVVLIFHASLMLGVMRGDRALTSIFGDNLGVLGVTLFFAISGFLMAQIAPTSRGAAFLTHRFFRIYPLFLAVALAVFFVKRAIGDQVPLDPFALGLVAGTRQFIIGPEWTLVFELCFYVVVFVAIAAGLASRIHLVAAAWLLIIAAYRIAGVNVYELPIPTAVKFMISETSVAFVLGLMIPALLRHWRPSWWTAAAGAGLSILAPVWPPLTPWFFGLGCAAIVASAAATNVPLQSRILLRLGDWSYAIYLAHVPVLLIVYALLPTAVEASLAWPLAIVAAMLAAVPLGILDVGLYGRLKRWVDRRSTVAAGALSACLAFGFVGPSLNLDFAVWQLRQAQLELVKTDAIGFPLADPRFPPELTIAERAARHGLLPSADLIGWLDRIGDGPNKNTTSFEGWAVDMSSRQPPVAFLYFNRQYFGAAVPDAPRPDVISALRLRRWGPSRVAFSRTIPIDACHSPGEIEALLVSGNRFAPIRNVRTVELDCAGLP